MKKNLFVVLVASLFLLACAKPSLEEPQVVIDVPVSKSFVGVIFELTVPISNIDANYYLLTDSKNRIYLSSTIFDLSKYLNFEVRLRGSLQHSTLADKPVDFLLVDQIDVISTPELSQEDVSYSSSEIGLSFVYDPSFTLDEFESKLTLQNSDSRELITLNLISKIESDIADLTLESYIANQEFDVIQEEFRTSKHRYKIYNLSSESTRYLLESNSFILDVSYINLDSSNTAYIEFDSFLDSLELVDLQLNNKLDLAEDETVDTAGSNSTEGLSSVEDAASLPTEGEDPVDSSFSSTSDNDSGVDASDSVDSSVLDFQSSTGTELENEFVLTIAKFESQVESVLESFSTSISYSFTDNNEFYVIYYDQNDNEKRALIDYSGDFKLLATFVEGSLADWDLESGVNVAFDRPLTVVNKDETGFLSPISLNEGFRIFESLGLKILAFYPTDWYFSRQEDVYVFTDDPQTFDPSMLISLMPESSVLEYSDLTTNENVQVSSNIYIKKLNAGFFKIEFIDETVDKSYVVESLRDN